MRIQATAERHYLVEVFTKFGFNQDDSQLLADTLVDADLRGISSHGIQRLAWYRRMIKEGTIIPQNKAKIIRELPGSVLVDANQNMGQLATVLATQKIIEKAKKTGVAIAVIRNSLLIRFPLLSKISIIYQNGKVSRINIIPSEFTLLLSLKSIITGLSFSFPMITGSFVTVCPTTCLYPSSISLYEEFGLTQTNPFSGESP